MNNRQSRMKEQKKCISCGKQDSNTLAGRCYCKSCAIIHSCNSSNRRDLLKMQGRCVQCGKRDERTVSGKTWCAECADKQKRFDEKRRQQNKEAISEKRREYSTRRRENHECLRCGKQDEYTLSGKIYCKSCSLDKSNRYNSARAIMVENGICIKCKGKVEPERIGKVLCASCSAKNAEQNRNYRQRLKENKNG